MSSEKYHQPDLFDSVVSRTAEDVQALLSAGRRRMDVELTLTRNRVRMISVHFDKPGSAKIRMHQAFLMAPDEVLVALRSYIRTHRRDAWKVVAAFARGIDGGEEPLIRRRRVLRHKGQHFDLKVIAREVNDTFFESGVRHRIGWGRGRTRRLRPGRRSRSMRMGSWNPATREVRIHPLLDDPRVPYEFMRYLVYHELLHAVVPSVERDNSRRDHPAEFRLLERRFPDVRRMHRLASELTETLLP